MKKRDLEAALLAANDGAILMNKAQIAKATGKGRNWVDQLTAGLIKVCGNSYFYKDVAEAMIGFKYSKEGLG